MQIAKIAIHSRSDQMSGIVCNMSSVVYLRQVTHKEKFIVLAGANWY